MPLTKIQLRPGVVRDVSSYTNEGGWYYCDKIRFRAGMPEKIGGWVRVSNDVMEGTCTALQPWAALSGQAYCAAGTNLKYYVELGSQLFDITPLRETAALGANPITTLISSKILTISDVGHGAGYHDYVTISGATGPINGIPTAEINAEHWISKVIDSNTYEITVTSTASATGFGGGGAVVAEYQIPVGLPYYVAGIGWGAGPWSEPPWGETTTPTIAGNLRMWSQNAFGEDLVFCDRGGNLYYWDSSIGTDTRAVHLLDMAGASDVPTVASYVLITDSRHVVALGCNPLGSGQQDPLMVRWSDTEDPVNWTPTPTNTAGGQRLTVGSTVMTARNTRLETLIWTDAALYSMQFVGGDLEFGFNMVGTPISLLGPNAVAVVGGTAFWIGNDKFYVYNGTISTLPCPLLRMFQTTHNNEQHYQVFAATNEQNTEVTWFYPSKGSLVVDRYITYNYNDNIWYFGTMGRSAWFDSGIRSLPMAADNVNNVLLYHESGVDDNSTTVPAPIYAYIESSDFDIGDGNQFVLISRVLPDVDFEGSTAASPVVSLTLKTRDSAGQTWNVSAGQPAVKTVNSISIGTPSTSPTEQFTPQLWVRLRGRQAVIRLESNMLGVQWQLGALRLDIRPDGRR